MRHLALVALVPLVLAPLACSSGPELSPEEADDDPAGAPLISHEASALPVTVADGARIALDDIGVVAPPPGMQVGIDVHRDDGTTSTFVVERSVDGTVRVVDLPPLSVSSSPNECADRAYTLEGFKWTKTLEWWFRASSTPKGYDADAVEDALRRAANDITTARNSCGLIDQVSAKNAYRGRTSAAANMTSTSTSVTCGKPDGKNVVSFGALPSKFLAVTCYWYSGGAAVEADVRIDAAHHAFFAGATVPAGCTKRFSIEATMTHEFGHAFGLGHVAEAKHGALTMSTAMGPCTMGPARLGLGDVRGLRALY